MIASLDEARLVLNKWREDRSRLIVLLSLDNRFGAFFPSAIIDCSDTEMRLDGTGESVGLRLNLRGAAFEYANPRDFPLLSGYSGDLRLGTSLLMRFPLGFMCGLFEVSAP